MTWKEIVGKSFSSESFDAYCHGIQWTTWRPSFIVLHNTGAPTLGQRPNGFTRQNISDLVSFYRDEKGWSAGPHLFVDDQQIWVFTPLTKSGVHSPSWNNQSLGLEMLGDYDHDDFSSGRGLRVSENAVRAMATLSVVLGLDPPSMRLHREDPLTTHACPGTGVKKLAMIQRVQDAPLETNAGEHGIG